MPTTRAAGSHDLHAQSLSGRKRQAGIRVLAGIDRMALGTAGTDGAARVQDPHIYR